jgi:hypothetical protein
VRVVAGVGFQQPKCASPLPPSVTLACFFTTCLPSVHCTCGFGGDHPIDFPISLWPPPVLRTECHQYITPGADYLFNTKQRDDLNDLEDSGVNIDSWGGAIFGRRVLLASMCDTLSCVRAQAHGLQVLVLLSDALMSHFVMAKVMRAAAVPIRA